RSRRRTSGGPSKISRASPSSRRTSFASLGRASEPLTIACDLRAEADTIRRSGSLAPHSRPPATMKAVDFYKLPRSIQDRFVGSVTSGFPPAPILVQKGGTPTKLLWLGLAG